MYGELKKIVKHGSIYTVGVILSKVVSFLLIPLYTNYLAPAEYGVLELLNLTIDVISTIIGIGMAAAVMRFYFKYNEQKKRNAVISSALMGTLTIMFLTSMVGVISSTFISKLVFSSVDYTIHFRIMFLTMFLSAGAEIPLIHIRARQESFRFVTINLARLILNLVLNIVFLVGFKMGVLGILYGGLITSFILSVYLLISTFRISGFKFDWVIYRSMLLFGAPLLISDISAFLLTFGDRFFLNHYNNLDDVGLYSLAYKFGILISLVLIAPFYQIWSTRFYDIAKQKEGKMVISKVLSYFVIAALIFSFSLSVLTKDILKVIANPSYWSAYKLVPVISFAYVLNGIIYVVGVGLLIKEKTKYVAIATFIAMVVNLFFNFLLIPQFGKTGAAYSTLISYTVRACFIYYFAQRVFKVVYEWRSIMTVIGIYILLLVIYFSFDIETIYISIAVAVLVSCLFVFLIYLTGIPSKYEKDYIKLMVRNPSRIIKIARNNFKIKAEN